MAHNIIRSCISQSLNTLGAVCELCFEQFVEGAEALEILSLRLMKNFSRLLTSFFFSQNPPHFISLLPVPCELRLSRLHALSCLLVLRACSPPKLSLSLVWNEISGTLTVLQ